MKKRHFFVIVFVVAATSVGIPTQVSAKLSIPKSLETSVRLVSRVIPGQTTTVSVPLPWRANLIGVSYVSTAKDQRGVGISSRAHTTGGWSSWEELGADDNGPTLPEASRARKVFTTEPLWVGTADGLEIRITLATGSRAIKDVQLQAYNTLGDSEPQGALSRAIHALGRLMTSQASPSLQPAQAAPTKPAIISRAQWGADPSHLNLPCPGIAPTLKMAFVHHTDTTNSYTASQSAAIVRSIYLYHTDSRGYCDIAYNFLIDRYGQIFEGRIGGVTNNVIGAHTGGYNYESVGVALLGQFSLVKPTSAMLGSLTKLLAWRLDLAHIPAIGTVKMTTGTGNDHTAAGTVVTLNRISGHRDVSYTSCPGSYVYADMAWIRSTTASIGRPKIYLPVVTGSLIRPDGDGVNDSARISATFSQSVTWTLQLTNAAGGLARRYSGVATSVAQVVDGSDGSGGLLPNGVYAWRLDATDSGGHHATPVSGSFTIVTSHPDGTILKDVAGTYVLSQGKRIAVGPTTQVSNFGTVGAVTTGPTERTRYAAAGDLGFREGTLLQGPDLHKYIWSANTLRPIDDSVFTALGYQSSAVILLDQTTLDGLPAGSAVTNTTVHPDGTLVKDPATGSTWVVRAGDRLPISALSRASNYRAQELVTATAGDLALPLGSPVPVREGTLIKDPSGGAPWIVSDGARHQFLSTSFFTAMGYTSSMLLTASSTDVSSLTVGHSVPSSTVPTHAAISGTAFSSVFQMTPSFTVGWSAVDEGNGISNYDVRWQRASYLGTFTSWATWKSATTATSAPFLGKPAYTYCFQTRARDNDFNVSAWSPSRCTILPADDTQLTSYGFKRYVGSAYYLGTYSMASAAGSTLTLTKVDLKRLSLVVVKCPGCGVIDVTWGATYLGRWNLNSTSWQQSALIAVRNYSTPRGVATLTIKVASSGKPVRIEGVGAGVA